MINALHLRVSDQLSLFDAGAGLRGDPKPISRVSRPTYSYAEGGSEVLRIAQWADGRDYRTRAAFAQTAHSCLATLSAEDAFDLAWLRDAAVPPLLADCGEYPVVDLFSGCGGLSLGVAEAARSLGLRFLSQLALDNDPDAAEVYATNFSPKEFLRGDINELLDGDIGAVPTKQERSLLGRIGTVNMLIGGPPCQGHSDLNNHTRREDPKNRLILKMVRFAELFEPRHVIIENVQGSMHDKTGSVATACQQLLALGYAVSGGVLRAVELGVPQTRKRFFVVASKIVRLDFEEIMLRHRTAPRSFDWACRDLEREGESVFDSAARHSATNRSRIDHLHDNDLYDLPDEVRPDCHRLKEHAYNAVYGRMYPDRPAPTITTGFGSTGQGRFVHPRQRRTITPHEAARLQFFPDSFQFGNRGRRALQKLIGNAVPSKLSFVLALELIASEVRSISK